MIVIAAALCLYAGFRRWTRYELIALWMLTILLNQNWSIDPDAPSRAAILVLALALWSLVWYGVGRGSRYLWDRAVATPAP